jgi:biotin carboxyl carrier protein
MPGAANIPMKAEILIAGTRRAVEILWGEFDGLAVSLDGVPVEVDVAETGADTYSILLAGRSMEAHVSQTAEGLLVRCGGQEFSAAVRDPRAWGGQNRELQAAEGRQRVTSPMPGKIIRVLIATGEAVKARQGLVVVEAMKMQNEIRAPKAGVIERVMVVEGQTISAGEALLFIA